MKELSASKADVGPRICAGAIFHIIRQQHTDSSPHSHCKFTSSVSLTREMSGFTPSPAELALVSQIFIKADPQKIGILTGDAALKVFDGAKLAPIVLGEIWGIADEDNNGWLSKKGVAIAVRLMGWAQKGEKVTQALVNKREFKHLVNGAYFLIIIAISRSFTYD